MIRNVGIAMILRSFRPASALKSALVTFFVLMSTAHAQQRSYLGRIKQLQLDEMKAGRVTTYYAPGDQERAKELAVLAEKAAGFFERELGVSFEFSLAALSPQKMVLAV